MRKANEKDFVLAHEKGYNTYVRVPDSRCKSAQDWWTSHSSKWQTVRNKWSDVYGRNTNLSLKKKVDNKALYKHLFSDKVSKGEDINQIIESFINL